MKAARGNTILLKICAATAFAAAIASAPAHAITQGVSNATLKPGSTGGGCATCHNPTPGSIASVTIQGPATLDAGATGIYTITATLTTPAAGIKMGVNVAAGDGALGNATGQQTKLENGEITHTGPNATLPVTTAGGSASYNFSYTMPVTAGAGTTHTLYATASLGQTGGWAHAPNFTVTTGQAASNPPRLSNISTRGQALTGGDVMIAGFVIGGAANKTVAVVVTGPSLGQFGIPNPLPNPTVRLTRANGTAVASNDDWATASNAAQLIAANLAPSHQLESAILINLAPGAYTAIVEGANGGTGTAVVAVYEVDGPTIPLVNISTRGRVGTGIDVMIGGFVIAGSASQKVAIVATGPSLGQFGIPNPLANPTLRLTTASGTTIATNDDWQQAPNAAEITQLNFDPAHPQESVILVTLAPGAYTAILEGVNGGVGVGVVGVYKAQ